MDLGLNGKTVIITGAASGIGRACAIRFAQEGAVVAASDIDDDKLRDVVDEICAAGGRAFSGHADVTSADQMQRLVDMVVTDCGRLDILFNVAGGAQPLPTHTMSIADYHRVIALNLHSVFFGVRAALPAMLQQGRGTILSTTSGAGLNAVTGLAAYGAAKAGVISLMKSVAVEYGRAGIRANTISPGPMDTPGLRAWLDTYPDGAARYGRQVPSGRLGTAQDIASVAVFLASEAAAFLNGAVIPVDGAIHARLATPGLDDF
ncbi:MAG: 3-oxoacyl-ACP reductase [Deltaproteobacteria bacterium]|nr:3-oxoacyl-ACP reductase [Deltaproteobacteria bacterium]